MDRERCRTVTTSALAWAGQLAVLLAVAVAIVWPAPVERGKLPGVFPASDLPLSHWSNAVVTRHVLLERGALPVWNPTFGGGRPMAGDPLAALWYPPTELLRVLPVGDYLLLTIVAHLVLAGLGMLLLARFAFRLGPLPALVAAVAYLATPRLVAHLGAGHLTLVQAAAWLPWVALALWLTVERPWRGGPLLAVTGALLLLAGHPQIAYYGGLMLAGVAAWLLARRWRMHGRGVALRAAGALAAAGILGALLAAVHLLPLLEFTRHSTRGDGIATTDTTTIWPALKALAGDWMPSGVPHEAMFDPGRAVLLLALAGLGWQLRRAWPLALGIALVFALALGVGSPLFDTAARVLPGYGDFRGIARVWFVALVGVAILAGFGAEGLLRLARRVSPRGAAALGVLGIAALAGNLVWTTNHLLHVNDITPLVTPNATELTVARAADGGRIFGAQRNVRQPVAAALGLELVDGQDPLLIASHADLMRIAAGYQFRGYELSLPPFQVYEPSYPTFQYPRPNPAVLAVMGITTVASWFEIDDRRLRKVDWSDNTHIYRLVEPSARATLYTRVVAGARLRLSSLRRQPTAVTELSRTADRATFRFTSTGDDGYLVLAWPLYPGWHAELDGRRVPVDAANGVLPAVRVPAGTHELVWEYDPASLRWGKRLSGAGLALTALWVGVGVIDRSRQFPGVRPPSGQSAAWSMAGSLAATGSGLGAAPSSRPSSSA